MITKQFLSLFFRYFKYLRPYRRQQITVFVLSGASVVLTLLIPYLSKLIVDEAIVSRRMPAFFILGFVATAVFVLNGVIKAGTDFLQRTIGLKVTYDLNKKFFEHLQKLPLNFFQTRSTGEHIFKINYDIEKISDIIIAAPQEFITIFPTLIFSILIIFYLDWQLAFVAIVLIPVLYLPAYYFTIIMRRILQAFLADAQNIFTRLEEIFSHIYLVKALRKEAKETESYLKALSANIAMRLKNVKLEVLANFSAGSLERIIIALITLLGGYQIIKGHITAGTFTAIMVYLTQLIGLQNRIAFFFQRITLGLVSCERIEEISREKPQAMIANEERKNIVLPDFKIEFKKVKFGYGSKEPLFDDFSLVIKERFVALSGASGCGKTTLLNLILGLQVPQQGEILIGGHNLQELGQDFLRNQLGVALQEPFLWNDTIENNIRYEVDTADRLTFLEVAVLCGVDEFVRELPQGYKTVVGEQACKLSEGQKQKIAIARALLKKPKVLFLDEAFSSMDSHSEERILANIIRNYRDIKLITVSHRLSAVMKAERVYFLSAYNKVVVDTPQNLLNSNKEFINLFSGQVPVEQKLEVRGF